MKSKIIHLGRGKSHTFFGKHSWSLFAGGCLLACACSKEGFFAPDCHSLRSALLQRDRGRLSSQIDEICIDLLPSATESDKQGQAKNLQLLVDRLNTACPDLQASMICYACILTLPPLSEIKVALDSSGISVDRTIDIVTSQNERLKFRAIH